MKHILVIFFLCLSMIVEAQPTTSDTVAWLSNRRIYKFGLRGGTTDTFMLKFHGTSGIGFPIGSTAQRPFVPTGWIVQRFNSDSLAFEFGNDAQAWTKMSASGAAGITTLTGLTDVNISSPSDGQVFVYRTSDSKWHNETSSLTTAFVNGLNAFGANSAIGNSDNFSLSIRTNNAARINISNAGAVSLPDGSLTVGGTTVGTINIQNASASTRGSIDLASNNPTLNTATGTWYFRQAGNGVGSYNGTGWFIGDLTTPANARLGFLAGTTSIALMQWNSGPLRTTPCDGCVERLTDKAYLTINTGTARKEFALWDAAGTSGRILFTTTNGRLLDDAALAWDNSTKVFQLGGTSSSFPGLLRDGASIQVKLADNSANANLKVLDQAYDATTWNGNDEVPTKNAVRDKIESLTTGAIVLVNDADHTVTSTQSAVRYHNAITAARTVTIPDPAGVTGREIWVKWNTINGGASINVTTTSGTALIYFDGTASSTSQSSNVSFLSVLLKSDGTSWYKIN